MQVRFSEGVFRRLHELKKKGMDAGRIVRGTEAVLSERSLPEILRRGNIFTIRVGRWMISVRGREDFFEILDID